MKEILTYKDEKGNMPVLEFLRKADSKIRAKLAYQIRILKSNGQMLCEPHVKHFTIERYKMLYEFRIKVSGKIVRIIFFELDGNIVLLHAFYKHGKRDTENALEYTLQLLRRLDASCLCEVRQL